MKIRLVAVGKISESWLKHGVAEYSQRLSKYCKLEIIEVADQPDHIPMAQRLCKEAKAIESVLSGRGKVVLLDLHGVQRSSEQFAAEFARWQVQGTSEITFVIAGSSGFDPDFRARQRERWCLSELTFTHQMTRLLLLEQLYRAFKINNNEKYHK